MRTFIREKKIYCGKSYREVDIFQYTDAQYRATRRTRSKKVRESEPKQKNLNDINARRYFIQLGNLNFGDDPDALHVSATYSPKYLPATVEDAEREATNYLRRISYRREKEGLPPLKYLLITSYTTKRNSDTPVRIHHHSTIYREIKRARWQYLDGDTWIVEDRYNPDGAEKRYRENLAAKGAPLKIGNDYELADYIERKILDEDRSPAAALADIKLEGKAFKTSICVSTLYSYITKGVFLSLTNADLPEKPKRKRPYRTVKKTGKRQNGKSIDKRPEIVDQRTTFGHWEGDTVYSKKDGSKALLVLTERLTRWEIIARIKDRTANSVIKALDQIERRFGADLFAKAFQTITFDNGGEFSDVERLERSAVRKGRRRTTAYFCHPYSSYERGSNECQNKMIRRKFPKGTDFGAVSAAAVKRAEDWINNYPREILGWKTAEICFRECLAALA